MSSNTLQYMLLLGCRLHPHFTPAWHAALPSWALPHLCTVTGGVWVCVHKPSDVWWRVCVYIVTIKSPRPSLIALLSRPCRVCLAQWKWVCITIWCSHAGRLWWAGRSAELGTGLAFSHNDAAAVFCPCLFFFLLLSLFIYHCIFMFISPFSCNEVQPVFPACILKAGNAAHVSIEGLECPIYCPI